MRLVDKEHEHVKTTITIEKKLLQLFNQYYPDVNLSFLVENILKEALRLKGVNYDLYEDKLLELKATKTLKSLKKVLATINLAKTTFSEDLFNKVKNESSTIYD